MHVRELIQSLSYGNLIESKILPDLRLFVINRHTQKPKIYPYWVHTSKMYATFGLYIDYIVRKMIANCVKDVNFGCDSLIEDVEFLFKYQNPKIMWHDIARETLVILLKRENMDVTDEMWIQTENVLNFIQSSITNMFIDTSHICYNIEYTFEHMQGHPDIVTSEAIYDIKTTINFQQMIDESFLQILCYLTLARANGFNPSYIGILLPLQKSLLQIDTHNIDTSQFLSFLLDTDYKIPTREPYNNPFDSVGTHLAKNKSILHTLQSFINSRPNTLPCQMFLRNPQRGGDSKITHKEMTEIQQLITNFGLKFYIHAPYVINLSNPYTKKNPTSNKWVLNMLKDDLQKGQSMGCSGVVVHTGKRLKMSNADALDKMENSIRLVLPSASPDCPLLIETPAGQGTELCVSYIEFKDFISRFDNDNRIGVCIDTQHVFAAGIEPFDYISQWLQDSPQTLKCIHFNDSAKPFGSRLDRHSPIGRGYIGTNKLLSIATLANKYNISMLIE